jgi:hypothetical protein
MTANWPNSEEVLKRWAIFIDVEGTSKLYETQKSRFFHAFESMLVSLYKIGEAAFPESPDRLCVHQVGGDGVVIVSEFEEGLPEIPISIAVVLMQVLLVNDVVSKGGISEGDFGDVRGYFPVLREIPKAGDGLIRLGRGCLTMFPVMGTALINSHRFASQPPRGCRLAIDPMLLNTVPAGVVLSKQAFDIAIVDWIHTHTLTMEWIFKKTGLRLPAPAELESRLISYVHSAGALSQEEWGLNSLQLNGCQTLKE